MDACTLEPAPKAEIATPPTNPVDGVRVLRWLFLATISVGVLWRLARYLGEFPIWGDEAMLLLNILERNYAGLTQHLRFAQVAPLFFLWLEKTAILALGPAEWTVHLFPFLAGLLALLFFWLTCRQALSPKVAAIAVAVLAVSYYPVRHSAEVKPYAFDLLYACIFAWLALGHLRNKESSAWLVGLLAVTPIGVFSSYPSVFVGGAVSIMLLPGMWRANWRQRSLYAAFIMALCGSFFAHYAMVGKPQVDIDEAQRIREFLHDYWKDAFPPESLVHWPAWLLKVMTGNMLAYPIGANRGGSAATFMLVVLGSIHLWRNQQRALLALCWLPFALNVSASIMHKYPFGESARITLHLAPFICILMAHGVAQCLDWIRSDAWSARVHGIVYVLLFACGAAGLVRDVLKPYKTEHDRDVRQLVIDLRAKVADDEPVFLCHSRDEELLAEFLWNMRTQSWRVDWHSSAALEATPRACWLVQCSNRELSESEVTAAIDLHVWRVTETGVRLVPPENAKMPPMYCRWVHLVRR